MLRAETFHFLNELERCFRVKYDTLDQAPYLHLRGKHAKARIVLTLKDTIHLAKLLNDEVCRDRPNLTFPTEPLVLMSDVFE